MKTYKYIGTEEQLLECGFEEYGTFNGFGSYRKLGYEFTPDLRFTSQKKLVLFDGRCPKPRNEVFVKLQDLIEKGLVEVV